MKRKDIKNLHHKSAAELVKELVTKQQLLLKTRLETKLKQEKNTRVSRLLRDDIARVQTIMKEIKNKEAVLKDSKTAS